MRIPLTTLMLCLGIAWPSTAAAAKSLGGSTPTEQLLVRVTGQPDSILLVDTFGRRCYALGAELCEIPESNVEELTEDDDDLAGGEANRTPSVIGFSITKALCGTYFLWIHSSQKVAIQIAADMHCAEHKVRSDSWGGSVEGRTVWTIHVDHDSNGCRVVVRKGPMKLKMKRRWETRY